MYITYNGNKYTCTRLRKAATGVVYKGLPEDFPAPIEGEMTLYTDKDFRLRTEKAENWLRQEFNGGVLVFTNQPEPEPVPEPEPDEPSEDDAPVTWAELAAAYTEGVNSIE